MPCLCWLRCVMLYFASCVRSVQCALPSCSRAPFFRTLCCVVLRVVCSSRAGALGRHTAVHHYFAFFYVRHRGLGCMHDLDRGEGRLSWALRCVGVSCIRATLWRVVCVALAGPRTDGCGFVVWKSYANTSSTEYCVPSRRHA